MNTAKTYEYIINDIPPSNNRYIGKNKMWEYRKVKAFWKDLVVRVVENNKPKEPLRRTNITIKYHFPDRKRRDPDNYSGKMILDGLTAAGVIIDDNFDVVNLLITAGQPDKENPRTKITVVDISDVD